MDLTSSEISGNGTPDLSWGDLVRRLCAHPYGGIAELIALAGNRETDWLEFKAALRPGPLGFKCKPNSSIVIENLDNYRWNVAKAVIAMANTCGGIVLIGIDDTCVPVGLTSGGVPLQKDGVDHFCREVFDVLTGGTIGSWKPLDSGGHGVFIECEKARIEGRCEILPFHFSEQQIIAVVVSPIKPDEEDLIRIVERPDSGREREVVLVRKRGAFGGNEELTTYMRQNEWKAALVRKSIKPVELWSEFCRLHPKEPTIDEGQLDIVADSYYQRLLRSRLWCEIDRCFTPLDGQEVLREECGGVSPEDRVTSLFDPDAMEDLDDPVAAWGDQDFGENSGASETSSCEQSSDVTPSGEIDEASNPDPRKGSVSQLIAQESRCVLLGEPGGGKSTSLRAMTLADLRSHEHGHRMSLFIPLARYNGDLDGLITRETLFPAKVVRQLADAGRLRLLLDALNECPNQYQDSCIAQIRSHLDEFPDLQVVITTRTHNYRRQFALPAFIVQPLADSRKGDFLRAYLQDPQCADTILTAISSNAAGELLTGNPLLLRLIAHVVNDGSDLPLGRAQLYRLFVEGWFRRECRRLSNAGQNVPWTLDAVRTAFGALAWKTRSAGCTSCTLHLANETLTENGVADASRFISTFALGLLYHVDVEAGILEFLHETFQEYFAAEFAVGSATLPAGWSITGERTHWQMIFAYALELHSDMSSSTLAALGKSNPLLFVLVSLQRGGSDNVVLESLRHRAPHVMNVLDRASKLALGNGFIDDVARRVRDSGIQIDSELAVQLVAQFRPYSEAVQYLASCGHGVWRSWEVLQAILVGSMANSGRWGALLSAVKGRGLIYLRSACLSRPWDGISHWARRQLSKPLARLPSAFVDAGLCTWGDFGLRNGLFERALLNNEQTCEIVIEELASQVWNMVVVKSCEHDVSLVHWAFPEGVHLPSDSMENQPESNDGMRVRIGLSDVAKCGASVYVVSEVYSFSPSPSRGLSQGTTLLGSITVVNEHGVTLTFQNGSIAVIPAYEKQWHDNRFPEEMLKVGDSIKVVLTRLDYWQGIARASIKSDKNVELRERRKELLEKTRCVSSFKVGQVVTGIVNNVRDYGAFVTINGVDGLLKLEDISWGRIKHPGEMVKVGESLEVVILDINHEKGQFSVGLKQLKANPWDAVDTNYQVGSRLRRTIVNLAPYGAFVEIEPGVEGLVHVSEISWTKRIVRASDVLSKGQVVDVVVISVNQEEHKIALSIRQAQINPWDSIRMRYPIGIRVTGKVLTMRSSGTVVELEEGLEGMIQESDMFWIDVFNHPSELLNEGDDVSAVVLDVDPDNQRIRLGLEQTSEERWCTIASRLKIGQIVTGKVTKLMSCGVVVMIAEGVGGLVHRSEICDQQINRAKDVLQLGQEVQVCIVRIDSANRSITLSILAVNTSGDEFERKHSKRNCFEPIVRADMPAHNSGEHE